MQTSMFVLVAFSMVLALVHCDGKKVVSEFEIKQGTHVLPSTGVVPHRVHFV